MQTAEEVKKNKIGQMGNYKLTNEQNWLFDVIRSISMAMS
jgi:hypothetical protein